MRPDFNSILTLRAVRVEKRVFSSEVVSHSWEVVDFSSEVVVSGRVGGRNRVGVL